jgi:hypothetical protein
MSDESIGGGGSATDGAATAGVATAGSGSDAGEVSGRDSVGAAGASGAADAGPAPLAPAPLALESLHAGAFQPYLEQTFTLSPLDLEGAPAIAATLAQVQERPDCTPPWAKRTGFSLLFAGPEEPVLPQALFDVTHPEAGRLSPVLLVPIQNPNGPFDRQVFYQCVIN